MQTIELFIIRDASNGDILEVSIDREDAEFQTTLFLGTHHGPDDAPIATRPVLETHLVELGEPIEKPRSGESLRRRVAARKRRQDAEMKALQAALQR